MITIRVLSGRGDNAFTYQDTQLEEAQTKFQELQNEGCTMFAVDPETKETTLVKELFKDCPVTEVIAVPQIAGG